MKKHSTGALTTKQKQQQDATYVQDHKYDYVLVGTGMAALSVGCLLVNAGKKVCLLEAHDVPGGYAHTFRMKDYHFCAQVHYIWGAGKDKGIYAFLKKIGLEKDITFELFDPEGYDHMVMPDGKRIKIPYGFDKLVVNIEAAYPGQGKYVKKFCKILMSIRKEIRKLPQRKIKWWELITKGWQFPTLMKYRTKTLQQVFDECRLSKEAQAVLNAQHGDYFCPPKDISIFSYTALFCGYNVGAYYPTKHFKYFTERLATFITDHEGCHIYYETPVTKINSEGNKIVSVETKDGKTFTGRRFICNMDPQKASHMIGREKFPSSYRKMLDYEYTPSGVTVFLGLKGIDLKKFGFGNFNVWHLEQWDLNQSWDEQLYQHKFDKPWVFISTPSLHTKESGVAPKGCETMELTTLAGYDHFKNLQDKSYGAYVKAKNEVADKMIDLVEEKYIPHFRKYIAVKVVGTPVTNEDYCMAPNGNAYGANLTPEAIGVNRLKADTPFKNFYWCNASSGYPGVHSTIRTGMALYMKLSRDIIYEEDKSPTDREQILRIRAKYNIK